MCTYGFFTSQVSWKVEEKEPQIQSGLWKSTTFKSLLPTPVNLYCIICRMDPNDASYVRSCWLYPLSLNFLQKIHE